MNKEIKEILSYLENRKDYVIWAGFAVFAHLTSFTRQKLLNCYLKMWLD